MPLKNKKNNFSSFKKIFFQKIFTDNFLRNKFFLNKKNYFLLLKNFFNMFVDFFRQELRRNIDLLFFIYIPCNMSDNNLSN